MSTAKRSRPRFRVGDWVTLKHYGTPGVFARIIEDRGEFGAPLHRVYRVRLQDDPEALDAFETSEENLEPAPLPDKPAVLRYLREGGLAAILSGNLAGGVNEPRAWLTFGPRGDLVHTFSADRGLIGGATVPFFALHDGKVFEAKAKEVLNFLTTFGLTRHEAEDVLRGVGTAP